MARLTLSFRDRILKAFSLDSNDCVIGREPGCDICIDSLAVQPQHARIRSVDDDFVLEGIDPQSPVLVNGKAVEDAQVLQEGDRIAIGKHELRFSAGTEQRDTPETVVQLPSVAWLQIQSGNHLGRTIRLDKAFTRIGRSDGELAVIAHRDDGYYLSQLRGEAVLTVNGEALGDTTRRLRDGDCLAIGELRVQFFADANATTTAAARGKAKATRHERRFSRIPFEAMATLEHEARRWQTTLIDVSLHGALVARPPDFDVDDEALRLSIALEGGPEIVMDVTVAHREEGQLGLCCRDIDVDSVSHLRRLVELNLGEAELLERELPALLQANQSSTSG